MIKIKYRIKRLQFLLARRYSRTDLFGFRCNICGKFPVSPVSAITDREALSCYFCGSNLRFRSIIAVLSKELFGEIVPIPDMPQSRGLVGIGISDSVVYAKPLAKIFSYTNTFYHKRPKLDIVNLSDDMQGIADFVITSEVLEHVPPPVETAFVNLFKMLKPNGLCILTVPYRNEGRTVEHFPDLNHYRIKGRGDRRILVNMTRDGRQQVFDNLVFHGGKGSTLETRLFSMDSLLANIQNAGFKEITIHRESFPKFGIRMEGINSSFTISMRKM